MSALKWTSLAVACLLVFSAQLGIQSLPLLLMGELFPSGDYFEEELIFKKWFYFSLNLLLSKNRIFKILLTFLRCQSFGQGNHKCCVMLLFSNHSQDLSKPAKWPQHFWSIFSGIFLLFKFKAKLLNSQWLTNLGCLDLTVVFVEFEFI